jgi:hypothetical protein
MTPYITFLWVESDFIVILLSKISDCADINIDYGFCFLCDFKIAGRNFVGRFFISINRGGLKGTRPLFINILGKKRIIKLRWSICLLLSLNSWRWFRSCNIDVDLYGV